jgi:hypothetical protein
MNNKKAKSLRALARMFAKINGRPPHEIDAIYNDMKKKYKYEKSHKKNNTYQKENPYAL